ncbi:MAG TPA: thiamine phosphate synthase [Candidatus Binatia bacterium]|nr:thiamine phosphate synthase [Candidatus Binatia bacterium]
MIQLPPLYAIVDPIDTRRSPVDLAAALLAGGARLLQMRLPKASARDLLAATDAVMPLARAHGALVVVNDRPDVARAAGADGVHVGQDDLPIPAARAVLGPGAIIGCSTHDPEQARIAEASGADYIGVGPIFDTTTKVDARPARGLELLRTVRAMVRIPIVAIGGITPATALEVRAAGADAVAMIAALVRSPDPSAAVRALLARLG